MLSPLVFAPKFFAAKYDGKGSQSEAQTEWVESLEDRYPHCKQGVAGFSANSYFRANPRSFSAMGGNQPPCGKIVEHYLSQGIYDGLSTFSEAAEKKAQQNIAGQSEHVDKLKADITAVTLRNGGKNQWSLLTRSELSSNVKQSYTEYSYSWWMKPGRDTPKKAVVLQYAAPDHSQVDFVSPAVWQVGHRLRAQVSLESNKDFSCEPEDALPTNKWTFVTLTVKSSSVDLFYDGKEACSCPTNDRVKKLDMPPASARRANDEQKGPFVSGGNSDASVQHMSYYPGVALDISLIRAQMQLHNMKDQLRKARRERKRELRESRSP
jgi:hypothetical protein